MQWLLEEKVCKIQSETVWIRLSLNMFLGPADSYPLLKVMVILEDAPHSFLARLSPQHADICTRGRQFWAQVPFYLEQQRAAVVAHCPLPAVLQSLVAAYAATTAEDMWANGLRVQASPAKRNEVG
jgi:hypothetical protein